MAKYDIKEKIVALTGADEVGYGAEGAAVYGKVINIEAAGNTDVFPLGFSGTETTQTYKLAAATVTALGLTGDWVVSVQRCCMVEGVAISSTASKQPAVGNALAVDGAGGVVKLASYAVADSAATIVTIGAICTNVDTTNNIATIRVI